MSHAEMHRWTAIGWALFALPVVLFWRESIVLVLLISIYANVVGHWAAYEAAKEKGPKDG